MPKSALDRAAEQIAAELQQDPTMQDLMKSQRYLAKAALIKAAGNQEDLDEWDDEQDDDHDEYDEEEDEDQDPDNPDLGSGVDNLRGVVGSPKKHRGVTKSRKAHEQAEDELVRAKLRLHKARRAEADADEAEDEDGFEKARQARKAAEKALNRARGKLQRAKPAWVGDEDTEAGDSRRRANDWDDVYADGNDSYYENEDANHEEDEIVPPDGPDVADGHDTDVYTIGAHKVRSKRAMRRSVGTKDDLVKSLAQDPRISEDLLDATPAFETILDVLGTQQDVLAKSLPALRRDNQQLRAVVQLLLKNAATQNRAMGQLSKSVQTLLKQPGPEQPMWGVPPQFNVLAGGQSKTKGQKLQKSRQDLVMDVEEGLRRGLVDSTLSQAVGRLATADEIYHVVPGPVQHQLGWN